MSPSKYHSVFGEQLGRRGRKDKASAKALRQAIARRRLEERREDQLLREHLYDVFCDDSAS